MVDKNYLLDNAQSFAPYGKTVKKKQIKVNKKGKVTITITDKELERTKKGKPKKDKKGHYIYSTISKKKYKFDPDAMVVL